MEHIQKFGALRFAFQVMSDTEIIAATPEATCNLHFDKALTAIENQSPDSCGIFIAGDVLNRGLAENWQHWRKILSKHPGLPAVYPMLGNHDLTDNGTYAELFANYMALSGMPGTYYDTWIGGCHCIVIAQEEAGHNRPLYSETQLKWLEAKLAEDVAYDKPIFLFSHYSIRNTSAGTYLGDQIGHAVGSTDKKRFMDLLYRYPQVVYFTGHTHFALTDPDTRYNVDTREGRGADIICDGSISYLADGTWEQIDGAQFLFVEVYEKGIMVRGWDIDKEAWIPEAIFAIDTTSKKPTAIPYPAVSLSKESVVAGETVTAYVTYEDRRRVEAENGAWVGIVSKPMGDMPGEVYRWCMLRDLPRDGDGRYVWELTDDTQVHQGSLAWNEIAKVPGTLTIGLFEDTLYLENQPTVPAYREKRYDPYACADTAVLEIHA